MKYVKLAVQYVVRNFVYLVLLAIIPSVLLGFTNQPSRMVVFFVDLVNNKVNASNGIFYVYKSLSIINMQSTGSFFASLGVILLAILFAGIIMSYIERHVRVGKFTFSNPLERLNDSLMSVFPLSIYLLLAYELYAFLISLLIYLAMLASSLIVTIVFAAIFLLLVLIGVSFALGLTLTAMPCMMDTGYSTSISVSQMVKLASKTLGKLAFALFIAFVLHALAAYGATFVDATLGLLINTASFMLIIQYICSLTMTSYYSLTGGERKDIARKRFPKF